jgi:hypothetical protein
LKQEEISSVISNLHVDPGCPIKNVEAPALTIIVQQLATGSLSDQFIIRSRLGAKGSTHHHKVQVDNKEKCLLYKASRGQRTFKLGN